MTYINEAVYGIYDKAPDGEKGALWRGEITPNDGIMPT